MLVCGVQWCNGGEGGSTFEGEGGGGVKLYLCDCTRIFHNNTPKRNGVLGLNCIL
jgi:hypothetical protein